ncbi:MAG: hypothetical protein JEZ00_09675 [Anaerolineaceae bacterium]|nr:hypothetical protein [Anaerolineaceae bacterium]
MDRKYKSGLIFLMIIFLAACSMKNGSSNVLEEIKKTEVCISPLSDFSLPIESFNYGELNEGIAIMPEEETILPGKPWSNVSAILYENTPGKENERREFVLSGIQKNDNQSEIWILEKYYPDKKDWKNVYHNYYIYNIVSREWRKISAMINENEKHKYISELFITDTGQIWGLNELWGSENSYYILSYYDDSQNKFFEDSRSVKIKELIQVPGSSLESEIVFDSQGYLWILASENGIYLYELQSGEVSKEITLEEGRIYGAKISPDGEIYYVSDIVNVEHPELLEGKMFEYSPASHELKTIDVPREGLFESNRVPSFFVFDSNGRLWIENKAYRDRDGQWYDILDNPLFITNNWIEGKSDRQFNAFPLLAQTASSDGNVWFTGREGTFKTNEKNKSWCWVSTEESIVLEDGNGYLWMLAGESLYKRPLDELEK